MVTFTAHLSVTIKRLTTYKQKVVLAAMLEGKSMPSNMAANTNHTSLLKNQSAIKYLPSMRFLSNFGCKIIFMCSVNFCHQQDSNSSFKGHWSRNLLVQLAYSTTSTSFTTSNSFTKFQSLCIAGIYLHTEEYKSCL